MARDDMTKTSMNTNEARETVASLRLAVHIAHATLRALQKLGYPTEVAISAVDEAESRYRHDSPLFVCAIDIEGLLTVDVDDEVPGLAHYTRSTYRRHSVDHLTLEDAMARSLPVYRQYLREALRDEDSDGRFLPTAIVLVDQFGTVVHRMDRGSGWMKPVLVPGADTDTSNTATLEAEASLEVCWDSVDAGRGLRTQASLLRERLAITKTQLSGRLVLGVRSQCMLGETSP